MSEVIVPEGWRLVPVEATSAIRDAIDLLCDYVDAFEDSDAFWRNLLAAAPSPSPVVCQRPAGLSRGWNLVRQCDGFVIGHGSTEPSQKHKDQALADGRVYVPFLAPDHGATCDGVNWKAVADEQRTVIDGLQAKLDKLVAERDTMIEGNGFWCDGTPPHPYGKEWFIAALKDGKKAVLRELPEEHSYDYKTADDTYYAKDWVVRWAQFPDSDFLLYATPAPAPDHSEDDHMVSVPRELLERAECHLSEGRLDGPASHELRALLAGGDQS